MGRIFKSIFAGGIIGFLLGLLFAPQKGEETRKKFTEAIDKGRKKLEEIKEEIKSEIEEEE